MLAYPTLQEILNEIYYNGFSTKKRKKNKTNKGAYPKGQVTTVIFPSNPNNGRSFEDVLSCPRLFYIKNYLVVFN